VSALVRPSVSYKESYIQAALESYAAGEQPEPDVKIIDERFADFVTRVLSWADRANPGVGLVPETVYWLIENDEYIGRVSIRHELTDNLLKYGGHIGYEIRPSKRKRGYGKEILRLALEKAKDLGLTRALVTCDEDNIGSKKIIEHNGGVLEDAVSVNGQTAKKLRYWIEIG
jgi:predicted acetyltransferase